MKKFIPLLLATLFLAACSLISGTDCGTPNQDLEWKGLSFTQPGCWTATDLGTALVIVNEDETNSVIFNSEAPDNLNLRSDLLMYENTAGETIYVSIGDPFIDADEVAIIVDSIVVVSSTTTNSSSCDAPDSTYPAAYTETWQGVDYSLPWCWTATDNISNLQLEDGDSDSYVRMTFSMEENEDPEVASQKVQLPGGETLYLYFRTEDFEDSQVQEVLYSVPSFNQ